jgi:cell wall-associated NlpC family hydrolase
MCTKLLGKKFGTGSAAHCSCEIRKIWNLEVFSMSAYLWNVSRKALAFVGCAALVSACGQQTRPEESEAQGFFPWSNNEPVKILQTESGDDIPDRVFNFLQSAEQFGKGVHTYRLGSYSRSVTDCSGFIAQAHRSTGYRVALHQFDWDALNFAGCTGQLRAGDVLLLAYPGRQPDHWVMMADVRSPNGKFNDASNIIMDVSSDYVDGKPFYKGPLSRRRNLLARNVYACRRHRSFERDWKQMLVQQEEAKKETLKPENSQTQQTQPVQQTQPAQQTQSTQESTPTAAPSPSPTPVQQAKSKPGSFLPWGN